MDELFILGLTIAVVILFFRQSRLKKRLNRLEGLQTGPDGNFVSTKVPNVAPMAADTRPDRPDARLDDVGPWKKVAAISGSNDNRETGPETPTDEASPPRKFVFRGQNLRNAGRWLAANWFLAVAALSLALAGVFLVQYGVENGLLSPFWRVMGAAFFGTALIWGGEFIRRRSGDGSDSHTAFLPSTFSGAGLVALFAAVLAARQLYGLIGSEAAFVYLIMVSAIAVVLGWFYGPFLAVVGILGSVAAPFLVGGESDSPALFFYYFALVAIAALAVDSVKRWAWVSAIALILTFGAAWYIWALGAGDEHFLAFGVITALAAIAVPRHSLWPNHTGTTALVGWVPQLSKERRAGRIWAEFPTRIAAGTFAGAVFVSMLVAFKNAGQAEVWLAIAALTFLFLVATVWFYKAPALDDLAPLAAFGFVAVLLVQALDYGVIYKAFQLGAERAPETAPPGSASLLAILALVGSGLAVWRSLWGGSRAQAWAAGAALLAPLVLVVLEISWQPLPIYGEARWAAHAMGTAAAMVFFAGLVARRDGDDKRRVAYFALAALTMISFALVVILSSAALTVALAVMVLAAAMIDRRLNLPLLGVFVQIGTIVIGWRLVLSPGLSWATDAPIWELVLAYGGSVGLLSAAWLALAERRRSRARLTVESGVWAILGVFASILLFRAMGGDVQSHWAVSLFSSVWLMLMLVQLYRLKAGAAWFRWVRIGLALIYATMALVGFAFVFLFFNPLAPLAVRHDPVVGPLIADSLFVAFGIPAAILIIGLWKLPHLMRWVRSGFVSAAALFGIAYIGFEVRRFWQGRDLSAHGATQGELYSYTIAMLLASVALLFFAFSRRSLALRRIATLGIAATIAKVFLIDMAGLNGLMRVASFLGLGLSLAGLGWIYGRMAAQWDQGKSETRPSV